MQQYATDEALFELIKQRGAIGMVCAIVDLLVDPIDIFGLPARPRVFFSLAIAVFVLFWVGYPILRKTLMAIGQRVINANLLLSAGAWGSFVVGALSLVDPRWPNFLPVAAWLMSLHLFFGYFKLDTRKKASEAVRKLLSLQPPRARVLRGRQPVDVLTKDVGIGEIVVVRPGERIPLDGEIVEGTASIDESSFTGESVPAAKTVGSKVIGGTLNLDGGLEVRVTRVGADSFLSQIVRLMTQIAERKPPLELLADKLMNYYGPVVFIVAGVAFAGWEIATGTVMVVSIFAILLNTLRIRGIDLHREDVAESHELAEVAFAVPSMVCEGCADKITTTLSPVAGVRAVTPRVPQKHVVVRYERSKVSEQQLKDALRDAGFEALEA